MNAEARGYERDPVDNAVAILIDSPAGRGRYFVRFGKGGRVMTAWSLAGAKLFMSASDSSMPLAKIRGKGKGAGLVPVARVMP